MTAVLDATVQFENGKPIAIARVFNLYDLPLSDPHAFDVSVLRFDSAPTITLEPRDAVGAEVAAGTD